MNPDPGGPKTYGSSGSGSATLVSPQNIPCEEKKGMSIRWNRVQLKPYQTNKNLLCCLHQRSVSCWVQNVRRQLSFYPPPRRSGAAIASPTARWRRFPASAAQLSGQPTGCRPPSPLPLRVAKAGRKHLDKEITPFLPTGIGERYSQTI
jgi:hypothetical protein